ncbi:unnamed protein product [Rangifer tarandus platyrhynchus]|uniref:Uncharacterized protein n=2 Tax=Rangifer tarandus platyrhynchus TaxID=3082113 RepID=A0ACB0EXT2_RANTA|nr:unnamed protein product [Rangifer tarandus platyrhynchus]CAI9704776.1 unnamed protein product [Rangifer tarandus platyrhynchus]
MGSGHFPRCTFTQCCPERCPGYPVLISTSLLGPKAFGRTEGAGKPDHLQPHSLKEVPRPPPHTRPRPPPSSQEPEGVRPAPELPGSRAPGRRGRGVRGRGRCVSPVSAPGFRSHQLPSGSSGVSPSCSEAPARRRRFAPLSPRRARLRKLLQPVSGSGPGGQQAARDTYWRRKGGSEGLPADVLTKHSQEAGAAAGRQRSWGAQRWCLCGGRSQEEAMVGPRPGRTWRRQESRVAKRSPIGSGAELVFPARLAGDADPGSAGRGAAGGRRHVRPGRPYIYNREEQVRFDSLVGEYRARTEMGRPAAERWNRWPHALQRARAAVRTFCASNYRFFASLTVQRRVEPEVTVYPAKTQPLQQHSLLVCSVNGFYPGHVEVRWFRNGREEEAGVVSTGLIRCLK